MVSLIRYGTLSALCLLISSLSAKAGMFPLMAVAHAAAHPSGPSADLYPAEASHDVTPHGIPQGSYILAVDAIAWSPGPTDQPLAGEASPAPVWLGSLSHKRATQFDLRS